MAKMAGVTNRTLHYYDEIGLLRPASHGENGYRYYADDAVLRLQQILFYRELDFSLDQIKAILNRPDFDLLHALEGHRRALQERLERTNRLIDTVDKTILHFQGKIKMKDQDFYSGFDEEKQKEYEKQARERWGDANVDESAKRWSSYSREKKNAVLAEGREITLNIVANMEKGHDSPEVQHWIERWHQSINDNFYDCSLEIFEGLGKMYNEDPEFRAFYEKIHPGLAAFMEKAMTHYCIVKA